MKLTAATFLARADAEAAARAAGTPDTGYTYFVQPTEALAKSAALAEQLRLAEQQSETKS